MVSAVAVARLTGPTVLAAYTTAGAAWDYKVNLERR
jgi:hypothetical protein